MSGKGGAAGRFDRPFAASARSSPRIDDHWDVVVIGAGPAGTFASMLLARLGSKVLLVERRRLPRDKVCGCCLSSGATATLRSAGLDSLLENSGAVPLGEVTIRAGGRELVTPLSGGRALSRRKLDASLAKSAVGEGAVVVDGVVARLGPVAGHGRMVLLEAAGDVREIRAGVVIAADGLGAGILRAARASSAGGEREARRRSGAVDRGVASRNAPIGVGTILDGSATNLPAGQVRMAVGPGGYVGTVRLEDGSIDVAAAITPASRDRDGIASAIVGILDAAGEAVPAGIDTAAWNGTPPLRRRSRSLAAERVLAIGDSAGFWEPFTGEGIEWALRAGRAVAPVALESSRCWDSGATSAWERSYRRWMLAAHRRCRAVSTLAWHPTLLRSALTFAGPRPAWVGRLLSHSRIPRTP